jgi:hypothetical protein
LHGDWDIEIGWRREEMESAVRRTVMCNNSTKPDYFGGSVEEGDELGFESIGEEEAEVVVLDANHN